MPVAAPHLADSETPLGSSSADRLDDPQIVQVGPSAPARRKPGHTRRRSSSISAAVSLIRSYSGKSGPSSIRRRSQDNDRASSIESSDELEDFAPTGMSAVREAHKAFARGRPSPYHIAFLTLVGALASGLPLASLFVLYQHAMCRVYSSSHEDAAATSTGGWIPPSPQLPPPGKCPDSWVQPATSSYTAAMATTGAVVSLILLQLASRYSARFGRKPVMLLAHLSIAAAFIAMRLAILLPTRLAGLSAVLLFVSVVVSDASSGAPMRISVQNYIVDVTTDASRASAFSFVEGTGQIGGFPASTIGGWLAAGTGDFFAPFYACSALFFLSCVYIFVFVPESKKNHVHTLIDDYERSEAAERAEAAQQDRSSDSVRSYSTVASMQARTFFQRLQALNFFRPLAIFIPHRVPSRSNPIKRPYSYRLFFIAIVILCEESYNVFILPMFLLFNGDQFGFSVVQNGYLVSLLQGSRALILTLVFPWVVQTLKNWKVKRVRRKEGDSERARLLDGSRGREEGYGLSRDSVDNEVTSAPEVDQTSVDFAVMATSYCFAALAFLVFASSRLPFWSTPWAPLILGILLLQCGSGSSSVRTALVVTAATRDAAATSEQDEANSDDGQSTDRGAIETRALAANQILSTGILATVPLITSAVYGLGLRRGTPEAVWILKGGFATMAAVVTVGLWVAEKRR